MSIDPTHSIEWDAFILLRKKPVLFAEFTVECAVQESRAGPYVEAVNLYLDTGRNRKTGQIENHICLTVPPKRDMRNLIRPLVEKEDWSGCLDILFAHQLGLQLRKDEVLLEELI